MARVVGRRGDAPLSSSRATRRLRPVRLTAGSRLQPPASHLLPATSPPNTAEQENPWSSRSSLAMKVLTKCMAKETIQSFSPAASTSISGSSSGSDSTVHGWKAAVGARAECSARCSSSGALVAYAELQFRLRPRRKVDAPWQEIGLWQKCTLFAPQLNNKILIF